LGQVSFRAIHYTGNLVMMKTDIQHPLVREIETLLDGAGSAPALSEALDRVLGHFGCVTGTLHRFDPASGLLRLCAQRGLPESLLPRVQMIPVGKGMAGLAAERRRPVQVCNLQTDITGVARPAARDSGMAGSIAVPLLQGGALRGVLGVAGPTIHEFDEEEIALLQEVGNTLVTAPDEP
jgi:GAF domain-containing protein